MSVTFITRADAIRDIQTQLFELIDAGDFVQLLAIMESLVNDQASNKDILLLARDGRPGYEGRTLLHALCRTTTATQTWSTNSVLKPIRYIIRLGQNINMYDSSGSLVTPLMEAIASFKGNPDIVTLLITSRANLDCRDINGDTAFHYAARVGSANLIKAMIEVADISADKIMELASTTNYKRKKMPEDLCKTSLCKEILQDLRTKGFHKPPQRRRKKT